jgi:hypothetical protein
VRFPTSRDMAMRWLWSSRSIAAPPDLGWCDDADENIDPEVERARSRGTECICSR